MKVIVTTIIISLFLFSCQKEKAGCFSGLGQQTKTIISIPSNIDYVVAKGRVHICFIQDSLNFLEIAGGQNVIKGIECVTENNILEIKDNNTCNCVRKLNMIPTVTIHYTTLHYFGAENYYDNYFLKQHKGDTILMEYWTGSGITKFTGDVDRAYFKVNAGPGGYECAGNTKYLYIYNCGSSKINCSEMSATDAFVVSSSNNDIYINCNNNLVGEIRRSGNIYYKGNPTTIKKIGKGSGEIIHEE